MFGLRAGCFAGQTFENIQTFTSSGSFIVPAGVTKLIVKAWGAGGGWGEGGNNTSNSGSGASGASVTAKVPVTPGETLSYVVGLLGKSSNVATPSSESTGVGVRGFGVDFEGANGGGYTGIFRGATPLVIAGGGGAGGSADAGSGGNPGGSGGRGGAPSGEDGTDGTGSGNLGSGGSGGTVVSGGAGGNDGGGGSAAGGKAGTSLQGGDGGYDSPAGTGLSGYRSGGGGAGGGYYGGGGGGAGGDGGSSSGAAGGGGGGSSYIIGTGVDTAYYQGASRTAPANTSDDDYNASYNGAAGVYSTAAKGGYLVLRY